MAQITAPLGIAAKPGKRLPGRRYDHVFFTVMAVAMFLTAFAGFARTYFLAGMFRAPLPSLIIHIHGAAFTSWVVLLVVQTSLVSVGRTDIHRRLGVAGFLLGCLMVILGVLAATDSLVRAASATAPTARDAKAFYIVPLTDMLIFAVCLYSAFRARFNSSAHKRYIYVATTALLIAAIARLPFSFGSRRVLVAALLTNIFLVILVGYDWWSTRTIHRATLRAGAFLIFVQQVRLPIGRSAAWHAFAAWVQTHAR
jgi:FtsH-binding integral membrane protein